MTVQLKTALLSHPWNQRSKFWPKKHEWKTYGKHWMCAFKNERKALHFLCSYLPACMNMELEEMATHIWFWRWGQCPRVWWDHLLHLSSSLPHCTDSLILLVTQAKKSYSCLSSLILSKKDIQSIYKCHWFCLQINPESFHLSPPLPFIPVWLQ